jgi:hypothetical protein
MSRKKTEMTGTGGGRWETREEAKTASDGLRRRDGKREAEGQRADMSAPDPTWPWAKGYEEWTDDD